MVQFRKGNMLKHLDECTFACITTNAMIKKDGTLVMGRGIAQQVRDSYPGIDQDFGDLIRGLGKPLPKYLMMHSDTYPKFIAFQVKYHWASDADIDLIGESCSSLSRWASHEPETIYFLNFPGIGNGRLGRDQVLSLVEQLPDNVIIWEYE